MTLKPDQIKTQSIFGVPIIIDQAFDTINSVGGQTHEVFGYLRDEQGVFLEYATKKLLPEIFNNLPSNSKIVDVGCGSGILGIVSYKTFEHELRAKNITHVGIDPNRQAIIQTKQNLELNKIRDISTQINDYYKSDQIPDNSAALILQNPPYHTTSSKYDDFFAISCSGKDGDGLGILRAQLTISSQHLAQDGAILGIVSCSGRDDLPSFLVPNSTSNFDVRKLYPDHQITWIPLYRPMPTSDFLKFTHRNQELEYIEELAGKNPMFHVGLYLIQNNHLAGEIKIQDFDFKLKESGWDFRLKAHRAIQDGAFKNYQNSHANS